MSFLISLIWLLITQNCNTVTTSLSGVGAILNLQFNPLQIGTSELVISDFLYNTDTITDTQNGIVTIISNYGDVDTNSYVQVYDAALALQYSVGLDPLPLTDPTPWENWKVIVGTAYSPSDNTEIMRIPLNCTDNEELTFNMIVNKNTVTTSFTVDCSLVGINETIIPALTIYPNPANDKIEIKGLPACVGLVDRQTGQVEFIDINDKVIKNVNVSNTKTSIDISKLSGGVYTIRIKTDE